MGSNKLEYGASHILGGVSVQVRTSVTIARERGA